MVQRQRPDPNPNPNPNPNPDPNSNPTPQIHVDIIHSFTNFISHTYEFHSAAPVVYHLLHEYAFNLLCAFNFMVVEGMAAT